MKLENSFFTNFSNMFNTSNNFKPKFENVFENSYDSLKLSYNCNCNKVDVQKNIYDIVYRINFINYNIHRHKKSKNHFDLNFSVKEVINCRDSLHLGFKIQNTKEIRLNSVKYNLDNWSCELKKSNKINDNENYLTSENSSQENIQQNSNLTLKYESKNVLISSKLNYNKSLHILSKVNFSLNLNDRVKSIVNLNLVKKNKKFSNNLSFGFLLYSVPFKNFEKKDIEESSTRNNQNFTSIIGLVINNINSMQVSFNKIDSFNIGFKYNTPITLIAKSICISSTIVFPAKDDYNKATYSLAYKVNFASKNNFQLVYLSSKNCLKSIFTFEYECFKLRSIIEFVNLWDTLLNNVRRIGIDIEVM